MGKAKKTRKFSVMKRTVANYKKQEEEAKKDKNDPELTKSVPQVSLALFFKYNEAIKPPYQVLIDTNFVNFSIQKKIDIVRGLMDCLLAKCIPIITDCVMAELEKLGPKYRIALKLAKDPRIQRLSCSHKGTYADDCLVNRVMQHKCYIVATNDADLKRRIRKVPGIPIMSVGGRTYVIERLPDVFWGRGKQLRALLQPNSAMGKRQRKSPNFSEDNPFIAVDGAPVVFDEPQYPIQWKGYEPIAISLHTYQPSLSLSQNYSNLLHSYTKLVEQVAKLNAAITVAGLHDPILASSTPLSLPHLTL